MTKAKSFHVSETYAEHNRDDNAAFSAVLQEWMRSKGVTTAVGAIVIALLPDGFDLLQIGPEAMSAEQVQEAVMFIGQALRDGLEPYRVEPPL